MKLPIILSGTALFFFHGLSGQSAPLQFAGPLKNITEAFGFSLSAGMPFTGTAPAFGDNKYNRTGSGADFGLGFSYGRRGAANWPEIGLSFSRYSAGYKWPDRDSLQYRLQSNYLGLDLRYCMTENGARSRNLFSLTLTPGISLRQRNLVYTMSDGEPVFGEAENYRKEVAPFNVALAVSGGKELDFTTETTARIELFTRWNTVFTRNGQGVISQLAIGLKLSLLYTR